MSIKEYGNTLLFFFISLGFETIFPIHVNECENISEPK